MAMLNELESQVSGQYIDTEGRVFPDVFETYDAKYLVVGVGTFDSLTGRLSEELALELYGDQLKARIIDDYRKEVERNKRRRTKSCMEAHQAYARRRWIEILALIVAGKRKADVVEILGVNKSTVNRALSSFQTEELAGVFRFNEEFDDVPEENRRAYIRCGGDYRKFQNWLWKRKAVRT